MSPRFIVPLAMCALLQQAGLDAVPFGADTHVNCRNQNDVNTFWAVRLAYLKANPHAED